MIESEATKVFYEDIRQKSSMRPKSRGISQKRPQTIVFPSDRIDRRNHPDYRNGKTTVRQLTKEERKMIDMRDMPTYEEFKQLPKNEQRDILAPLSQNYTDREIAEMMGCEAKDINNRRHSLGIRKQPRRTTSPGQAQPQEVVYVPVENGAVVVADNNRMVLAIRGKFKTNELRQRLESLSMILPEGDNIELEVDIKITEPYLSHSSTNGTAPVS